MLTRSVPAMVFWHLLQRSDMGASIKGPDDVEVYAATDLAALLSPEATTAVWESLVHWQAYDGHRMRDFLMSLIEGLNNIPE